MWFTENPWPPMLIAALAAVVFLMMWSGNRRGLHFVLAVACLLAAAGIYLLERLIVTDGEANDASQLVAYLPDVLSRGIIVDAIGVDMQQDHSLATRVHSYRRADDDAALAKAVQEVFAERSDSNVADDREYQLLQAIDNETAVEALKLLSKPNNAPIIGIKQPETWSPNTNLVATKPSGGFSILGTLCVGLGTCMLPILVLIFVISLFFSRAKRR